MTFDLAVTTYAGYTGLHGILGATNTTGNAQIHMTMMGPLRNVSLRITPHTERLFTNVKTRAQTQAGPGVQPYS